MQVVERQGQRIEVEVVGIVDEQRIVDPVADFESHGQRRSRRERGLRKIHRRTERFDDLRVAPPGRIAHDLHRRLGHRGGVEQPSIAITPDDHPRERFVKTVVDDRAGAAGQRDLLVAFLFEAGKILLMRIADRGEDHHIRSQYPLQPLHFAGFRNSGFENRQLLVAFEHQHRERHAQLRIETLRRTEKLHPCGQLLGDPLFDDGFAVRTGDTHHRTAEPGPVESRQALQRLDGMLHPHVSAAGRRLDFAFDQESHNAATPHLLDIIVRIVVGTAHRHEQRGSPGSCQRTAVGHHRLHRPVTSEKRSAADGGDFGKKIFHDRFLSNNTTLHRLGFSTFISYRLVDASRPLAAFINPTLP